MNQPKLVFLKLGGSLITDKHKPLTPKVKVIRRISKEINQAVRDNPQLSLLIGHGSGSFGHAIANQYQTQSGGEGKDYWEGFARVWRAARDLNQIVVNELSNAGLPVIAFPPSSGVTATSKKLQSWGTRPLSLALSHGLIPVVQGDVVFDTKLGGTIFSTEEIFYHLAKVYQPKQILLAGSDKGVYRDPKQPQDIIPVITPENINNVLPNLSGAEATDVTGGMSGKVQLMLSLAKELTTVNIQIFSGIEAGQIQKALTGEILGTKISSQSSI